MKRTLAAFILTTALCVLANREAVAQTWQTVDQFQLDPSFSAAANDIGTGGDGATLFSVGWVIFNSSGNNAGIIRRSTDSGATWSTVDTYLEENWTSAYYRAIGSGADGAIYAGGEIWAGAPNTGTKTWIVRESVDNGTTWATADAFYEGMGAKPSCGDVKVNPYTGDVFAVGRGNTGSDQGFYWLARKRAANAQDFATVDLVGAPPINEARAVGFHPTAGVFVVGRIGDSHGNSLWSVRRSRDGGATWATVDTFSDAGNTSSEARAIAVNPLSGAIYVCGQAIQAVKGRLVNNWVVRSSLNGGTTWATVDRFGAEPAPYGSGNATATGITLAPSGNVYITGVTADPSHLIVRKGTTSSKGVMSWVTSNDFQLSPGEPSSAQAIATDGSGNIFTAGIGRVNGVGRFLTRKVTGPQ